jgi:forkhead box protein J2/3
MDQQQQMSQTMSLQQTDTIMSQSQEGSNPYYPEGTDLSGGLPINLDSLRDGPPGSKPFYPYSTLIRYEQVSHISAIMC